MDPQKLLEVVYVRESPFLQANDWASLRIPVMQLIQVHASIPPDEVLDAVVELRRHGKIMLLPDWERWGLDEDEADGETTESLTQWEPHGNTPDEPLAWRCRQVHIPNAGNLRHWYVRSRIAETVRLIAANRERFGLEPATAHLGYELQERKRPNRNIAVTSVVSDLTDLASSGAFPEAVETTALVQAIEIVGTSLGHSEIAGFQARAWEAILRGLFGDATSPLATMLTAGVSSGKTFGFLLPAVTMLVYRALLGDGGVNRVLVIYPRTSLVEDQFHSLHRLLLRVNVEMERRGLAPRLTPMPALDAGNMLGSSLQIEGSLADILPQVAQRRLEVILTTPESLKNRLLDPRASCTYLARVELVVFDEVHLMEGLSGCQQIHFIRRMRELMRQMRNNNEFQPTWVGASATVAQPVDHACRVFSISDDLRSRVAHIRPEPDEMVRFATFHHVFVHTRVGKPAISAVTNGLSCLTHTRNDGTAHTHYQDPSATPLVPRASEEMPKTIAFVDSLSTIGRLDFTTRDNERCWRADEETPYPYYTWFYRPAARLRATRTEERQITHLADIRAWCQKCYHGIPARIGAAALQQLPAFLRTARSIRTSAEDKATPPGLCAALRGLQGQVGNLDQCPFLRSCVCWWFSQDRGDMRNLGQVPIYIDQNRPIIYTSRSGNTSRTLSPNVNDFFRRATTGSDGLWYVRDDNLRRTLPREPEPVSTMLASPRIEVGVDFQCVRDGLTHKALRSAASFQQKVGRVGREDSSDSLIVTFLAHRSTDAHFAHHPARLIDSQQLDPIPLCSENHDVLATHLFTAILEYIGSRPPGVIPDRGEALNIIGTGSARRVPESWAAKVQTCRDYLAANRRHVLDYILRATGHPAPNPEERRLAECAMDSIRDVFDLLLTDLTPAYAEGETAAHWFKQNRPPTERPGFRQLVLQRQSILEDLRQVTGVAQPLAASIQALATAVEQGQAAGFAAAVTNYQSSLMPAVSGLDPNVSLVLMRALTGALAAQPAMAALTPTCSLMQLLLARELVQQFFSVETDLRVQQQYYFHDILTSLFAFRRFYPYGLLRTHFQPIQAREVTISVQGAQATTREDTESLDSVLYELLPGTWNYRWGRGLKSPCGRIDQTASGEWFIDVSRLVGRALFEPTVTTFTRAELPLDMGTVLPGASVPMLRPVCLTMEGSRNQPLVRREDGLVGDGDEAPQPDISQSPPRCPTLPRAFPATWYRVTLDQSVQPIVGVAAPRSTSPVPHTFPAAGRVLLAMATFTEEMKVDRYVYALDRTYGTEVQSPRLHYWLSTPNPGPIVIGDTLMSTDGVTLRLREPLIDNVLDEALSTAGALRGEMTLRALRTFITQTARCDAFRCLMLRKIVAAAYLDAGGTLSALDSNVTRQTISGITAGRYQSLSQALLDGTFAGADPAEVATTRQRQESWFQEAWDDLARLQSDVAGFDDAFVRSVTRAVFVHSLAVCSIDAASQLVGASDGDLNYFYSAGRGEVYLFDSVDGGNGYSETVAKFLQIPPLRRVLSARDGDPVGDLPSVDWFALFQEVLSACPAQTATQLLWEACCQGVTDPARISFPPDLPLRDLEARLRHEFDPVTGAASIVSELIRTNPTVFSDWPDLLWAQVVPEYFALQMVQAGIAPNLSSLITRMQICVSGCLECFNNGDGSVHGSLLSHEHVSRNLIDLLLRVTRRQEPNAFLPIAAGADLGGALQARTGDPVLLPNGQPATATVREDNVTRQVMLTQVLGGVAAAPDDATGPLLARQGTDWGLQLPLVASYRDERPQTT